jgi:tRNA modification GTPase
LKISTKNKNGIKELKEKIKEIVCDVNPETLEFSTNLRQQNCLEQAKTSLLIALDGAERGELQDLISIDVKSALLALDEITGEVITDDILNNIFDNFCIGK